MKSGSGPAGPVEREFGVHEMFFSTTDARGVILAGNDVFARVSGYAREELVGRPHNIIRHPDMPRAAFRQLWDNVRAGRPFAGYVKNRARDGAPYWVYAVIVPLSGGRLLSIRFKPTSREFASVEGLYAAIRTVEAEAVAAGRTPPASAGVGLEDLGRRLAELGCVGYDAFAEEALVREMRARDEHLAAAGRRLFPERLPDGPVAAGRRALYRRGCQTYAATEALFGLLEAFARMSRSLREETDAVLGLAGDFRLSALNANVASSRLGHAGACVSVIASFLTTYSATLNTETDRLRTSLAEATRATHAINAHVARARLQMEMILAYEAEIAAGGADDEALRSVLEESFGASTAALAAAADDLGRHLRPVMASRDLLQQAVTSIQMAQVRGLTEAARLGEGSGLRAMFDEFRARTERARREIASVSDLLDEFRALLGEMPGRIEVCRRRAAEARAAPALVGAG